MKRLAMFRETITFLAAPFSAFAGKQLESYLETFSLPFALMMLLEFLLILAVFWGILRLAELFLSLTFVRKLVMGRQFVEGAWMDIVRESGHTTYVGILWFSIDNDMPKITGQNFTADGILASTFNTDLVSVSWPVIRLQFLVDHPSANSPETISFSRLVFTERNGPPLQYSGYYQHISGVRGDYVGWRITDRNTLATLDDPTAVRQLVIEAAQQHASTRPQRSPKMTIAGTPDNTDAGRSK